VDREKTKSDNTVVYESPNNNADLTEKTKVEEIQGNKFIQEYNSMGPKSKQENAEITKNNKQSVIADDSEETKKLNKIIQLEDIKSHSNKVDYSKSVHTSGNIPETSHVPRIPDFTTSFNLMRNTKISQSNLARSLATIAGSKIGSKLIKGTNSVTNPINKFLLVNSIIKGIHSENYASLGITGAKIGLDVGIDRIISHGTKVFETTGKMSKFTKIVGKWGGPFSAGIDVGLSVWGLTKAIDRLNNPHATKFERNDAIADIVQGSIDIGVTTAVTAASLAFPPLAPVFAVVGIVINLLTFLFVGLFKASNHVRELKSKIELLDFEKNTEFWRHVAGMETSHYLQSLIFVKNANNLITGQYEKVLRNNKNLSGVVFPSSTSSLDSHSNTCTLYVKFSHCFLFSCSQWSNSFVVGTQCNLKGDCLNYPIGNYEWNTKEHFIQESVKYKEKCLDQGYSIDFTELSFEALNLRFQCHCENLPERDSMVDFRARDIFWPRRSRPDALKYSNSEFKCRPNTRIDYGHQVSATFWENAYYCDNAIAIVNNFRVGKLGTYFSIDLGEGVDVAYMSDTNSKDFNVFLVGDGEKTFTGGSGVHQFVISGDCKALRGVLDGGAGTDDTLVISKSCSPSKPIRISSDSKNTMTMETDYPHFDVFNNIISLGILSLTYWLREKKYYTYNGPVSGLTILNVESIS